MPRPKLSTERTSKSGPTQRPPVPKRPVRSKPGKRPPSDQTSNHGAAESRTSKADDLSLATLLATSLRDRTFLKLVLSQPLQNSESATSKVTVRLIEIGGQTLYQWTERSSSKERHDNLSSDELVVRAKSEFGVNFGDAHLFTTEADLAVRWNYGKPLKIKRKPPSHRASEAEGHNRQKQYLIPAGVPCPFLVEIGVMNSNGQVRASMYHKFRQINRFLEFVEDVLPHLPASGPIHVVDFGCGKSYLTFALHYLLTVIHGREVVITGLDVKQEVIEDCGRIASKLHCAGLDFRIGRIEGFKAASRVHLAVSLHACDTATDDALAAALRWKCEVILAVPCCQHEVCQILGRQTLPGLTEYGILKERFASLATDALRAQFLELNGYRTQVLEFIETEHTAKNVLLRAIRRPDASQTDFALRREVYEQLKGVLGLDHWHLETAAIDVAPADSN